MKAFLEGRKNYNKYPKYKDSGIDWLGEVPDGWESLPVWMLFFLGRGRVISNEEILDNAGDYPVYSSQTEDNGILGFINTYDFEGEYITWTTDGANAGTVFYRKGKFNCTNVCGTLKEKGLRKLDLRYMTHALNCITKVFVRYDINPKLMNNVIAGIRIQVPTYEVQKSIANFLDREITKIDQLLEKKQKLIELLLEKRTALISNAVTKGLDPNAKMKDSGVEWLGEIPEGWEVDYLKNLGYFASSGIDKKIIEGEPLVQMVNYTDIYGNESHTIDGNRELMTVSCPAWKIPESNLIKGDLVFTPSSETIEDIGLSALIFENLDDTVFSYHVIRFRFSKPFDHGFKKYWCNNTFVLQQFSSVAKGTTRQILDRNDFKNIQVVVPPAEEQKKVADFLDRETGKINQLIQKIQTQIEKLKEYRTALISEAVTGKIKVN